MEISGIKSTLAKILIHLGVSADLLTWAGLLTAFYSGWLITQESFFIAGVVLLLSGLLDMLDGAVARASGTASAFGGILDSSLDRYGDAVVLGGAAIYYSSVDDLLLFAALIALSGSFVISYVRARAECEVEDCRVGFWERGERLVLVALSLFLNALPAALCLLAVGTHWTVFQRLALAKHRTKGRAAEQLPFYLRTSPRNSWKYFLKILLLISGLFFFRLIN